MNTSGVLVLIAGAWVLCQVLGGGALGRLGIIPIGDPAAGGRLGDGIDVPAPDDGYGPGYRDGSGRPL